MATIGDGFCFEFQFTRTSLHVLVKEISQVPTTMLLVSPNPWAVRLG